MLLEEEKDKKVTCRMKSFLLRVSVFLSSFARAVGPLSSQRKLHLKKSLKLLN